MAEFVPGLELARRYYDECVAPIVGAVPHAAARIGWGSDVLGYDTPRSTDHGWGPHLDVFVARGDDQLEVAVRLDAELPDEFLGWPTRYGWDDVTPRHWVEIRTLERFLQHRLGCDPRPVPSTRDWLVFPHQRLRELTSGAVFHDPEGELAALRRTLRWFPDDVWRYVLAAQWQRVSQEEPFVGRAAEIDDDLGSRVVAARLVRMLMQQCFFIERVWPPYSKWFGRGFADLDAASELSPTFRAVLAADTIDARHTALGVGYEAVARRCNALGLTAEIDPSPRTFYGRPYVVLDAARFTAALRATIADPVLRDGRMIGTVDQWSESTDVLEDVERLARLRAAYG
jgi:hypothetical protein